MNLTHEQAAKFRLLRPRLWKVKNELAALASELNRTCPHTDENDPDCPVCWVYQAVSDAESELHDAPDQLEGALMRGPHPNAKEPAP